MFFFFSFDMVVINFFHLVFIFKRKYRRWVWTKTKSQFKRNNTRCEILIHSNYKLIIIKQTFSMTWLRRNKKRKSKQYLHYKHKLILLLILSQWNTNVINIEFDRSMNSHTHTRTVPYVVDYIKQHTDTIHINLYYKNIDIQGSFTRSPSWHMNIFLFFSSIHLINQKKTFHRQTSFYVPARYFISSKRKKYKKRRKQKWKLHAHKHRFVFFCGTWDKVLMFLLDNAEHTKK